MYVVRDTVTLGGYTRWSRAWNVETCERPHCKSEIGREKMLYLFVLLDILFLESIYLSAWRDSCVSHRR